MKYQLNKLTQDQVDALGKKLSEGQIAVIPTDTQYGIVTSALSRKSVEKIYQLRKRSANKPMIILISDLTDIAKFDINLTEHQISELKKLWPNPVSIILPADNLQFQYLHRGKNSLAFRMPQLEWLQNLLKKSGPLVAPSANFEGEPPASTIEEAEKYFSSQVDFYIDNGLISNPGSTVIKFDNHDFQVIRQGIFKVK